jgi:dienelactone hydrolase
MAHLAAICNVNFVQDFPSPSVARFLLYQSKHREILAMSMHRCRAFSAIICLAVTANACGPGDSDHPAAADKKNSITADADTLEKDGAAKPAAAGTVTTTDETPFPGSKLFVAAGGAAKPGILMLHGSEGGASDHLHKDGQALAEQGFHVLAFCYFGCEGRPDQIAEIPLDETVRALQWLKTSTYVAGRKVGIYGGSRGAEQAVLIASLLESADLLSAVAVSAPFDYVMVSFDPNDENSTVPGVAAWSWKGQSLPSALDSKFSQAVTAGESADGNFPYLDPYYYDPYYYDPYYYDPYYYDPDFDPLHPDDGQQTSSFDPPFCLIPGEPVFLNTIVDSTDVLDINAYGTAGRIEIEKYRGPLLLIHGTNDGLWPVEASKRLERARTRTKAYTKAIYPGTCHYPVEQTDVDRHRNNLFEFFGRELR